MLNVTRFLFRNVTTDAVCLDGNELLDGILITCMDFVAVVAFVNVVACI